MSDAADRKTTLTIRRVVTAIALLVTAVVVPATSSTRAATLDVCPSGCSYSTVQAALSAASAGDTVDIAAGTYTEQLTVPVDVTITGDGPATTILSGGDTGTVLTVPAGVTATVTDLTITDGTSAGNGGGVVNEGTLTVRRVEVTGNTVPDGGAGIFNTGVLEVHASEIVANVGMTDGTGGIGGGGIASAGTGSSVLLVDSVVARNSLVTPGTDSRGGGGIAAVQSELTIEQSDILGNESGYSSGGIYVSGSQATLFLVESTVAGNVTGTDPNRATGRGGGISVRSSARATIIASTISGNEAAGSGGGIHAAAPTEVVNSTITGNSAATAGGGVHAEVGVSFEAVTIADNVAENYGGGIYGFDRTMTADGLLLANNTAGIEGPDCYTTIDVADGTASLVEQSDATICVVSGTGTAITGVDPILGALADNGGPTLTRLPLEGSPAIDATDTTLVVDQRGESRPSGAAGDIGAVEVQQGSAGAPFELVPTWGGVGGDFGARAIATDGTTCGWEPGETVELLWDDPAVPLTSTTVDADGCFEMAVFDTTERIGGAPLGTHKVIAAGTVTGAAQAAYELVPRTLDLGPPVGPPGRVTTVGGCGWAGASNVNVYWADTGELIGRDMPIDAAGCLTGDATIPNVRADGLYAVVAAEGAFPGPDPAPGATASLFWVREATVFLTPPEGPPGGRVELAGCGWFPDETVEFRSLTDDLVFDTVATVENGCFRSDGPNPVTMAIPASASTGHHVIRATGADSGQQVDTDFAVFEPYITLDPVQGAPGDPVSITGCSWVGNTQITVEWGYPDTNNQPIRWNHPIDPLTGCLAEPGLSIEVPSNTPTGLVSVTTTGDVSGVANDLFEVIHAGTFTITPTDVVAGETVVAQIEGAIVGETIEFRMVSRFRDTFDSVGAARSDFSYDLTLPTDVNVGQTSVAAIGSKGFDASADINVLDTSTLEVTTSPLAPGVRMEVVGTEWGSRSRVDFELRPTGGSDADWVRLGSVNLAEGVQDFAVTLTLPDDLTDGSYDLRAEGARGREQTLQIELTSPTLLVSPPGAAAGGDIDVTGDTWAPGELVLFSVRQQMGTETQPLGTAALAAADGTIDRVVDLPASLDDGSYELIGEGETGRTGTASFWIGERSVALTITQVRLLQSQFDGVEILGDLYARLQVDSPGFPTVTADFRDDHTNDAPVADPMWTQGFVLPSSAPRVMPVEVSLFDWDSGADPANEEQADIDPDPAEESVVLNIDTVDGSWDGAPGGQGCTAGDVTDIAVEVCFATSVVSTTGDIDDDGFLDRWELDGLDLRGDGTVEIDLPDMGANPCRATIGVDYGAMPNRQPTSDAIDAVVRAFDVAPTDPPTGCDFVGGQPEGGIDLLIDDVALEPYEDEYGCGDIAVDRDRRQSGLRGRLFHYAMFVNRRPNTSSTGVACGDGKIIISLGEPDSDSTKRLVKESSTFMHELGHALGLWHGGFENENYKPNYLSSMNYRFQIAGQFTADGSTYVLDYSREELPWLNEDALTEEPLTSANLETAWVGPDRSTKLKAPANAPIDWNDDGPTPSSEPYAQDVNGGGWCVGPGKDGTLDTTIPDDVDDEEMVHARSGDDRIHAGDDGICDTEADGDSDDKQIRDVGTDTRTLLRGHDDWDAIKLRARNNRRGYGLEVDRIPEDPEPTIEELDEQYDLWFSPSLAVDSPSVSVLVGDAAANTGTIADADGDAVTLSASIGGVTDRGDGTWSWTHTPQAPGEYTVTITADDGDEGETTARFLLVVDDRPAPTVTVDPVEQTVQHSDGVQDVTVRATGVGPDDLVLTTDGLPDGVGAVDDGCAPDAEGVACAWTLTGEVTDAAGSYPAELVVTDAGVPSEPVEVVFEVEPEPVDVDLSGNPAAVPAGDPFQLEAVVAESAPDVGLGGAFPGDVTAAEVTMRLVPIGPGPIVEPDGCTSTGNGLAGYDQQLSVDCDFAGVAANGYVIEVEVAGGRFVGTGERVLGVHGADAGRVTGRAAFEWPGDGGRTLAVLAARSRPGWSGPRGAATIVRFEPDTWHVLTADELETLATGELTGGGSWAVLTGSASARGSIWDPPDGGLHLTVYVEDRGGWWGGNDEIHVELRDATGQVITSTAGTVPLTAGNLRVP